MENVQMARIPQVKAAWEIFRPMTTEYQVWRAMAKTKNPEDMSPI
jgi:hypothetical protein